MDTDSSSEDSYDEPSSCSEISSDPIEGVMSDDQGEDNNQEVVAEICGEGLTLHYVMDGGEGGAVEVDPNDTVGMMLARIPGYNNEIHQATHEGNPLNDKRQQISQLGLVGDDVIKLSVGPVEHAKLLLKDAKIPCKSMSYRSCLKKGNVDGIKLLCEARVRAPSGITSECVRSGNFEVFSVICNAFGKPSHSTISSILSRRLCGNVQTMLPMLKKSIECDLVSMSPPKPDTPNFLWGCLGSVEAVRGLVELGVDPHQVVKKRNLLSRPLSLPVAKYLIEEVGLRCCKIGNANIGTLRSKEAELYKLYIDKAGYPPLCKKAVLFSCRQSRVPVVKLLIEEYKNNPDEVGGIKGEQVTALIKAARSGSLELCTLLLDLGADVNRTVGDPEYNSPLTAAVRDASKRNNVDIVKLLLSRGADINLLTHPPPACLLSAFVAKGYNVNTPCGHPPAAAMVAAVSGSLDEYLHHGANPDGVGVASAPLVAAAGDNFENVLLLLHAGADPNGVDESGNNALHACGLQKERFCKKLLRAGTNPLHKNLEGKTPLMTESTPETLRWFLNEMGNMGMLKEVLRVKDDDGRSVLFYMETVGKLNTLLDVMGEHGLSVDLTEKDNNDVSLYMAMAGDTEMFAHLSSLEIFNVADKDNLGRTFHFHAALNGAVCMLQQGPPLDLADINGKTISMYVAEASSGDVFLSPTYNTRPDAVDNLGRTNVMYAASSGYTGQEVLTSPVRCKEGKTALMYFYENNTRTRIEDPSKEALLITDNLGTTAYMHTLLHSTRSTPKFQPDFHVVDKKGRFPLLVVPKLKTVMGLNDCDVDGVTPLMAAKESKSADTLLKAGADPSAKDAKGKTVAMYMAQHSRTALVAVLREAEAAVDQVDGDGRNLLSYAMVPRTARVLIQEHPRLLKGVDKLGRNPLNYVTNCRVANMLMRKNVPHTHVDTLRGTILDGANAVSNVALYMLYKSCGVGHGNADLALYNLVSSYDTTERPKKLILRNKKHEHVLHVAKSLLTAGASFQWPHPTDATCAETLLETHRNPDPTLRLVKKLLLQKNEE